MPERLTRRDLLLGTGLSAATLGTGLALGGLVRPSHEQSLYQPASPEPKASPTPTEVTTPTERSPEPDSFSILEEPGIHLSQPEIDLIAHTRNRLSAFEPAEEIIVTNDPSRGDGTTLYLNESIFTNEPQSVERLTSELPYLMARSIPERILREGRDGHKIEALGKFMRSYETWLVDDGISGLEAYNPYNGLTAYEADEAVMSERLNEPMSGFGVIVSSLAVYLDTTHQRIDEMPVEQAQTDPSHSEYYQVDSPPRRVARSAMTETFLLLKVAARPIGATLHDGSLATIVDQAFPRFGVVRYQLAIST